MTTVVTVSDDRFGRKEGMYAETQHRIYHLLRNSHLGINQYAMYTWKDIVQTDFYKMHEQLLSQTDPARNGRAYKPYVILDTLRKVKDGDFVIYTDCSPEMWRQDLDISKERYKLQILQELCVMNRGILSPFVTWDTRSIPRSGLGIHTHRNFTMDLCINAMQCEAYTDSFMHASGMMVFQKRPLVMHFMNEWLHYNLIPECACLGDPNIPDDYSYWTDHEDRYKMGHRHDQSISGLILNQMGHDLIQPPPAEYHPYNFLNFCRVEHNYQFVNSNTPVEPVRIKKGDTVRNTAGEVLRVFDIWPGGVNEYYIVGKHRESAYKTTEDKLKVVTDDIQVPAILNK